MLFNSYPFLLLFLPLFLFTYWTYFSQRRHSRLLWITAASYVFYGTWDYRFVLLMLGSTMIDYLAGSKIANSRHPDQRKRWLMVSIFVNLAALGFFKYANFGLDSTNILLSWFGIETGLSTLNIILPVGISFYTFQSMSYTIDLYRGKTEPAPDFLHLACYVSLFPQLVAGPIVRYQDLSTQLEAGSAHRNRANDIVEGIYFFVIGLVKKLIVADALAGYVDPLLSGNRYLELGLVASWTTMLGYTFQLYFDFSGYSDMAVGLAKLMGFDLPQNFASPYKATSIADFWRRWHITLSSWLRDYLYIPLGGSRQGQMNTFRNLLITMFLGGLWHGAGWTFVFWGLYHGLLLIINQLLGRIALLKGFQHLGRPVTFISVVFGWVLFRSESLDKAIVIWQSMLGFNGIGLRQLTTHQFGLQFTLLVLACLIAVNILPNTWELRPQPIRRLAFVMGLAFAICLMIMQKPSPFLYFQF